MKRFYLILGTVLTTFVSYSQSADTIVTPLKRFWGYGSIGQSYMDVTTMDRDFLSKRLEAYKIPTNPLQTVSKYGMYLGFAHNKMFYSATAAYDAETKPLNDTLNLKTSVGVLGVAIGQNVIVRKKFILSPYAGLKYNRFRNITYFEHAQTIDNYLNNRDIDIRIHQFSMTVGLSFAFKERNYVYGFYIGYVQKLHLNALMYSAGHRLANPYGSPIGLLNIGIGMGLGG